ncbi:hypothetical protein BZG36_01430 [Bifiguratus adelaidae]|uniref:RING-type E3 ubiquitin transferase n=1 Tax=Bifiguratus adelaidae TaxID=1938954 RepID=A0A261Y536_9FUNG|nr:hypothetical protein BZG36_01430 [Bifiguratus adelaidae]
MTDVLEGNSAASIAAPLPTAVQEVVEMSAGEYDGSDVRQEEEQPERAAIAEVISSDDEDAFQPTLARDTTTFIAQEEQLSQEVTVSQILEANTCSVCLEPWSSNGAHRVVSIRCGHMFGRSCILKWLHKDRKEQRAKCPECNQIFTKRDIRPIWARFITAADTSKLENALSETAKMQHDNRLLQSELSNMRLALSMAKSELMRLENETGSHETEVSAPKPPVLNCQLEEKIDLRHDSNIVARALAYDPLAKMIIVAFTNSTPGKQPFHGIWKISLRDTNFKEAVELHSKTIRDVKMDPHGRGYLLSTGMDKTIRVTKLTEGQNSTILSYKLPSPGWTCCWSTKTPDYFFCGMSNGTLLMFDMRNTRHPIGIWEDQSLTGGTPVHSLWYLERDGSTDRDEESIIGATTWVGIFRIHFWPNEYDQEPLRLFPDFYDLQEGRIRAEAVREDIGPNPKDQTCYSFNYDAPSGYYLLSYRSRLATTHIIGHSPSSRGLKRMLVKEYPGGQTALSRTLLFPLDIDRVNHEQPTFFICAGCEAAKCVNLCDQFDSYQRTLPDISNVMDLKWLSPAKSDNLLACLTDTQLLLYSLHFDPEIKPG